MDIRSFTINYEVNAVIYDETKAKELEQDFKNDLQYCTKWTLEAYKSRNVFIRLRDSICRLASPLL
jgi:cardiolipin synthase